MNITGFFYNYFSNQIDALILARKFNINPKFLDLIFFPSLDISDCVVLNNPPADWLYISM